MRCLWILDINLLSFASFANIFSHSIGCLLVLLMVSHAKLKLLNLIMCHLFPPPLFFFCLGKLTWRKYCYNSVECFMVSCFTFRLLHHLSLFSMCNLFVYMVLSNFTVLYVAVQLLKHHLLKRLSFCLLCHRLIDHRCMDLFLGSPFWSLIYVSVFVPSITLIWLL